MNLRQGQDATGGRTPGDGSNSFRPGPASSTWPGRRSPRPATLTAATAIGQICAQVTRRQPDSPRSTEPNAARARPSGLGR